ncbi:MAG: zf-HC2 domain-containing protein [Deltaproteobacteria bacterium]|nr:zf-HC2 domain-containing protein [Deltaproteobacteria bacterium]
MTKRRCRDAAAWLAAEEAGALSPAERIRLQRHLESCATCRARAQGLSGVARMVREGTPHLSDGRSEHLWQAVRAGKGPAREGSATIPWGAIPRWAWVGAGAFGVTMVALWVFSAAPGPDQPGVGGPKLAAPVVVKVSTVSTAWAPAGWRVIEHLGVLGVGAADRASLEVKSGGRLVLRSDHETVTAAGDTRMSWVAGGVLRLKGGVLRIRSYAGRHSRLIVRVGPIEVHPLGTAYELRWPSPQGDCLRVAEGRVRVLGGARLRLDVPAGYGWGPGVASHRLSVIARARLGRALGVKDGISARVSPGATVGAMGPVTGLPPRVSTKITVSSRIRPVVSSRTVSRWDPRAISPVGAGRDATLPAIERLLLAGRITEARRDARRALARGDPPRAALHTLIAEGYLSERRYRLAHDAYLEAYRARPTTSVGANALYLAGTLEFERLRQTSLAKTRFSRYLKRYPAGLQRQGAYYMLFRCLKRLGDVKGVEAIVRRYREAYPRGPYVTVIRPVASSKVP